MTDFRITLWFAASLVLLALFGGFVVGRRYPEQGPYRPYRQSRLMYNARTGRICDPMPKLRAPLAPADSSKIEKSEKTGSLDDVVSVAPGPSSTKTAPLSDVVDVTGPPSTSIAPVPEKPEKKSVFQPGDWQPRLVLAKVDELRVLSEQRNRYPQETQRNRCN